MGLGFNSSNMIISATEHRTWSWSPIILMDSDLHAGLYNQHSSCYPVSCHWSEQIIYLPACPTLLLITTLLWYHHYLHSPHTHNMLLLYGYLTCFIVNQSWAGHVTCCVAALLPTCFHIFMMGVREVWAGQSWDMVHWTLAPGTRHSVHTYSATVMSQVIQIV